MPLSACGGVLRSYLLRFLRARLSPSGAVSTLIGLFSFAGPSSAPVPSRDKQEQPDALAEQIEAVAAELDSVIYSLYGLAPHDIAAVEQTA